MADEDFETLTVRLPKTLKATVEAVAHASGITITAFVRESLEAAIAPKTRTYELPGFSAKFSAFMEEHYGKEIMLLVEEPSGRRIFHDGALLPPTTNRALTNESLVTLVGEGFHGATVPRRDIVGWVSWNTRAEYDSLVRVLIDMGWHPGRTRRLA